MPSSGNHTVILYPFVLSYEPLNLSFIYTSVHPLTYITIHLTIHPSAVYSSSHAAICLPTHAFIHPPICPLIHPVIQPSNPLSIHTPICPLIYVPNHPTFTHPSIIHPLIYLSVHLSIHLSIHLPICLYIHLANQLPTHPRFVFSCPDSLCTHASLTGRLPTDHHSVSGTLLRTDDTIFSTDKNSCPHGAHPTPLAFLPSNYPTSYPSISPFLCTGRGLRILQMNQTQARYLRSHDRVKIDH